MTEDITHGLTLLADEVEPAPIDTDAVITTARARTRNRRAVTTVVASVAAIGALTMTLTTDRSTETATNGEGPSARLTAQLAAAVPDVIPSRWEVAPAYPVDPTNGTPPSPLQFGCNSESPPIATSQLLGLPLPVEHFGTGGDWDRCWARAWYVDADGTLDLTLEVNNSGQWFFEPCAAPECDESTLPDGTRVRVTNTTGVSPAGHLQQVEGLRPDGTHIHVYLNWGDDRSEPPLTLDELKKFADKFDY